MTRLSLLLSASLIGLTAAPVFAEETGTVFSTNPGVRLSFSGQVNRGVLFADDGEETETFFVDNDNSSTRFRFKAEGDIASNTVAGINIEIEAESNSTPFPTMPPRSISQGRRLLGIPALKMPLVGFSSATARAIFRARRSASAGVAGSGETGDEFYDVAARYKGNFGAVKVDSALAYVQTPNDDEIVNGSVSFLHEDSGLSLTLAGATMEFDDPTDDRDTLFGYVKVGYKTDAITQMGKTAFAIDYAYNEDVLQVGDESTSVGLLAVQNITAINSELYVGVRNYELERPGASFEDVTIVLAGARIRF